MKIEEVIPCIGTLIVIIGLLFGFNSNGEKEVIGYACMSFGLLINVIYLVHCLRKRKMN